MKKLLVLIFACLASTVMFAQTLPLHYSVATGTDYQSMQTKLNVLLVIDGVEMKSTDYEIGAFGQDGACLGAKRPLYRQNTDQYIYMLLLKGYKEDIFPTTEYTFKVYDWSSGEELDLTYTGETYTYIGSNSYSTISAPINLTFVSNSAEQTFEKEILGYGTEQNHWYLISSPVGEVDVNYVENLEVDPVENYDLYYFDQAADDEGNEWINYIKLGGGINEDFGTTLKLGKGYLYARKETGTIIFKGTPLDANEVTIPLDEYAAGEADAPNHWAGWNLIGNPFTVAATITKPYYRMNGEGTEIMSEAEDGPIGLMEGVFVVTAAEDETLTITASDAKAKISKLALNLSNGRHIIDRAIVRFSEGQQLPKISLNENSTKVYIPMDDQDYAVVRSEGMGELPVNFKAESNGTYTFSFNAEEVTFGYLHLIDNLTGNEVDLLANPSYSFEASTTDYASRFKLVFATGDADDTFAFFSNGSFVINNEGNATLQVIDVTGRILSSETINGCANVNVNAANGVYMLRLVNGDNVKTQKVVVR